MKANGYLELWRTWRNKDQDAQIIEQCGDSSDDEDDERFSVLGEWREEGFGNPVVQILVGDF